MNDKTTTVQELRQLMKKFVDDRDWNQFHNAKNLSMTLATEVAELMEYFRFASFNEIPEIFKKDRDGIEKEVADVFLALMAFANAYNIDVTTAVKKKLEILNRRYPADVVRGSHNAKEIVGHQKGA